jgi:hypothetical protein
MEQPSHRTVVNTLVGRLNGGDVYQANPAPAPLVVWPPLVLSAPRFDPWSNGCLVILAVVILATFLGVLAVLMRASADKQAALAFAVLGVAVLPLLALMFLAVTNAYWMARWGKIVLAGDRLIEYKMFNRKRAFTYRQIYEIRLPREIRYYACDESGQIDYRCIRHAHLSTVRAPRKLAEELQRRICAPLPSLEAYSAFLDRVVGRMVMVSLGGGVLILAIAVLVWALPGQRWLYGLESVVAISWVAAVAWLRIQLGLECWCEGGAPAWMDS